MIPVSETAANIASQPCSVAIKQALDNITNSKTKKDEIMKEIVDKLANLNLIEQLMEVHTGKKSKEEVFSGQKEIFNIEFQRIQE